MIAPALWLPRDHYANDPQVAWLTLALLGLMAVLSVALIVAAVL